MKKTHITWRDMRRRCYDPKCKQYKFYGGRGIGVDKRWDDFSKFLDDMGIRPDGMTLGRINNDLSYQKDNCRWETRAQQSENRRRWVNTSLKVEGVCFKRKYNSKYNSFHAYAKTSLGKQKHLYWGKDFFEACCARKSWEARNLR